MYKLFSFVKKTISLLVILFFTYFLYNLFFGKEKAYSCDSEVVETVIGKIVKKDNFDIFQKYLDTRITVSEVQTLKKDSETNKSDCSARLNIMLKDKNFNTKIRYEVAELKKTDKPLWVEIKDYYPNVNNIVKDYISFTKLLEKEEQDKKDLIEAKKLGFNNLQEYKEYLIFRVNYASIHKRLEKVKIETNEYEKLIDNKKNKFKEKNFEYLKNDYVDILNVTYNKTTNKLEIKVKNKHNHKINYLDLEIYTFDKDLNQTMILSSSNWNYIYPNKTEILTVNNPDFSRYFAKEKKLSYFIDIKNINLVDEYGRYSGKLNYNYKKEYLSYMSKIEKNSILNKKEEIKKQINYIKNLENQKKYYENFFNSIKKQ